MELMLRGISKSFDATPVLQRITLDFREGVVAILGPNGAGKTTLMRILATVLAPDEGTLQVNGRGGEAALAAIRSQVGYLPQSLELPQHLTPRGLLRYVASLRPSGIREETAMRLLAEVGLESMADRPLAQLSDGQRRLAAVAQAFLGWPKLVLLDEFSAGLDVAEKEAVFRLIHRVETASLVVITSNLPAEVEKIARQLIVLRDGVIQFTGTAAELVRQAQGRVWEGRLPVNEANSTMERYRLSRVRQADDGVTLRIVGTEPDLVGAWPVEPTLEDAYLLLMGNAIKH